MNIKENQGTKQIQKKNTQRHWERVKKEKREYSAEVMARKKREEKESLQVNIKET